MKTQTAVAWLEDQITKHTWYDEEGFGHVSVSILDIEQAKEMEKSQMINFADDYVDNCVIPNENMAIPTKMDVPEYYNETYGKQTDSN